MLISLILFDALDEAKQSSELSPACKDAARTARFSWEGRKERSLSKTASVEPSVTVQQCLLLGRLPAVLCALPDVSMSLSCPERSDTNHWRRPMCGLYCAVLYKIHK